jgi:hypothetical protein
MGQCGIIPICRWPSIDVIVRSAKAVIRTTHEHRNTTNARRAGNGANARYSCLERSTGNSGGIIPANGNSNRRVPSQQPLSAPSHGGPPSRKHLPPKSLGPLESPSRMQPKRSLQMQEPQHRAEHSCEVPHVYQPVRVLLPQTRARPYRPARCGRHGSLLR